MMLPSAIVTRILPLWNHHHNVFNTLPPQQRRLPRRSRLFKYHYHRFQNFCVSFWLIIAILQLVVIGNVNQEYHSLLSSTTATTTTTTCRVGFASGFMISIPSSSKTAATTTTIQKNNNHHQIIRLESSSSSHEQEEEQQEEEGEEGQQRQHPAHYSVSPTSSPPSPLRRQLRNKKHHQYHHRNNEDTRDNTRISSRSSRNSHPNDGENSTTYSFWEEELSITAFNMDLHNLAMDDAEKAQDALEIMERLYNETHATATANNDIINLQATSVVRPDSASYTTVIEGWCYGHYPDAAEKATQLLQKMENSDYLEPNELGYLLVCQQWAESYKEDDREGTNAQKAHDILTTMKQRGTHKPSVKLYSIVLEGWCRRVGKVAHAMDRAEELLEEMENSSASTTITTTTTKNDNNNKNSNGVVGASSNIVRPNVLTYTSIIGGLARSKKRDMATRADQMLERMLQRGIEPDMVIYTAILNCWAKTRSIEERRKAAERAFDILKQMEDAYTKEENYYVKPNAITYATAIKAIGNSLGSDAPKLTEQVLWHMYNLTSTDEGKQLHISPNVGTYNAVITSLSTCGGGRSNKAAKLASARRAEHLLVDMLKRSRDNGETAVEPNVRSWGGVLRAWAESGVPDSGEQAQRVLDLLEKWYKEGKSPIRPNVVCYTTVMNAWARGYSRHARNVALDKVDQLLRTMETEYEETRDIDIRPNKISYVTAIDAFCRKCKDQAGSKAQETVDRMVRLYSLGIGYDRPTRIVFNALINAWSRSSEPNAAQQAEKIFRWMESQYQAGDDYVKPDEVTLSGVLNAWANNAHNGGAMRAQEILDHTESLSVEERGFEHSIICHNILIKAWGRSREPDSVQRAEQILLNLENNYKENKYNIRPDVTTYSSVINCCAYYSGGDNEGRSKAFQVALRTFAKLREAGEVPNNITYGTLFKAISKLTTVDEESREELVKKCFAMCCTEGQVDSFVLSQVRQASSSELFRKLILIPWSLSVEDEHDIDQIIQNMPSKYGRNVNTY